MSQCGATPRGGDEAARPRVLEYGGHAARQEINAGFRADGPQEVDPPIGSSKRQIAADADDAVLPQALTTARLQTSS